MDKVGLRELLKAAVVAAERMRTAEAAGGTDHILDPDTIVDRVAQVGVVALDHDQAWLWEEVVGSLLAIYRLGLPQDRDAWHPEASAGLWMARVAQRVLLLGALCRRMGKYAELRQLVVQRPVERYSDTYWLRYAVTMASRGDVAEVFKGKSLIGPASESVRQKGEFFPRFKENMDEVVNSMCQFDYLACVVGIAETRTLESVYPNFGAYYSHRTLPVVHELIENGTAARRAVAEVTVEFLAEIIEELGKQARSAFFGIAGWDGYDREVHLFLTEHAQRNPSSARERL